MTKNILFLNNNNWIKHKSNEKYFDNEQ
jgi:hypothetical protein